MSKYPVTADLSTPANFRMFKRYLALTGDTASKAARDLIVKGLKNCVAADTMPAPKAPAPAKKAAKKVATKKVRAKPSRTGEGYTRSPAP